MYHCKIARTEREFEAIARLNYETFVEEIPQHEPNGARLLVDKFHNENTYIVLYKNETLIGMLAFRDQRPFSIDGKIGAVEQYLKPEQCAKMCEVRLLAIKKDYRIGRVFLKLAQALYTYVLGKGYSACVISGVTSQEHLYKHIGFKQFADAVGTEEARYLPMVLTSEDGQKFYAQFQKKQTVFYPGPVKQGVPLELTNVSHRSEQFLQLEKKLREQLLEMSESQHVALLSGGGTLANEVMLQQVKARVGKAKGFICVNGEFGARLVKQAERIGLQFEVYERPWGKSFKREHIEQLASEAAWCAFVHGETSSGMLNELSLFVEMKKRYNLLLAVDCVSSFGAVPFSLEAVDLASATSGKAVGALAGLSFVFYKEKPVSDGALYTDLAQYDGRLPYTLPAYLIGNVDDALTAYPARYDMLANRLEQVLQLEGLKKLKTSEHFATAVTFLGTPAFVLDAQLNGFELHAQSEYLRNRQFVQLSTVQPSFEKDFAVFSEWLSLYVQIEEELLYEGAQ